MISYKTVIEYFSAISERHQQIQSFTYGEKDFIDDDKFTKYPALHVMLNTTAVDEQVVVYGFDVSIYDRYNVDDNRMRNEANCMSDTLLILQDLCMELHGGKYFIHEDTNIRLELPILASPFIFERGGNCAGFTTSFDITTPNEVTACNIPYFNPEIQKALTYILPKSVPSELAWWSREQVHSKASFVDNELVSLSPVVDTVSGSDTLVMDGSGVTWSVEKNAFKLLDISESSKLNLEHGIIDTNQATFFLRIKDFGRYASGINTNTLCYFGDTASFTNGFYIDINSSGGIRCFSFSDTETVNSDFAVVPTNGTTAEEQHRRIESLTLCIQVTSTKVIIWIGLDNKMEFDTEFTFDDKKFGLGNPSNIYMSDFYLQEYIYSPNTTTDESIRETLIWLNER